MCWEKSHNSREHLQISLLVIVACKIFSLSTRLFCSLFCHKWLFTLYIERGNVPLHSCGIYTMHNALRVWLELIPRLSVLFDRVFTLTSFIDNTTDPFSSCVQESFTVLLRFSTLKPLTVITLECQLSSTVFFFPYYFCFCISKRHLGRVKCAFHSSCCCI